MESRLVAKITLVLSLCTAAATARTARAEDADAIAAAKLLFGEGLKVDADAASGKVSIQYGTVNATRVKKLIDDYLAPEVERQRSGYTFNADYQIFLTDYTKHAQAGGNAFVLMEPALKRAMCVHIAENLSDQGKAKELEDWCRWTSARLARHTLHEFTGTPVTETAAALYNGKLGYTDKLFSDAGFTLIVPGVAGTSNIQTMRVQQNMLEYIPDENRFRADATKLSQQNAAWIKAREAEVAALDKKQGGKGGKVVFGMRWFGPWDAVPALTKIDSCRDVFWKAFAPAKLNKKGAVFIWETAVDGGVCKGDFIQSDWIAVGGFWTGKSGDCSAPLQAPGKHTVSVQLYTNKDVKTGRKKIDWQSVDRATVSDEIMGMKDKVVAKGSLSCQSPEGLKISGE